MALYILYRISDQGNLKNKLEGKDKIYCLTNFLHNFGKEGLIVFADNCQPETIAKIRALGIDPVQTQNNSHGASFRYVSNYAMHHFHEDDIIYFLEDDYLHLPGSRQLLLEGIAISDYVTLYDHPDKYAFTSGFTNPFVKNGGEKGRILLTASSHWKTTNSTTMTVAMRLKTLKEDWYFWKKYTSGPETRSFALFKKLQSNGKLINKLIGKKRRLISPIPGYSTHIEKAFLSPLINWSEV